VVVDVTDGAILALGLSSIGFAVSAIVMWWAYRSALGKIADPEKKEELNTELRGKILVTIQLPSTVIVFALAAFILASREHISDELFVAVCFNMGFSGMIVALAEGLLVKVDAARVVENPEHWGKSIVNLIVFELAAVFSVAIAIGSMGVNGGTATSMVEANYIIAIASLGTLVSFGLMQRADMEDLGKRFLMASPGMLVTLIGFLWAYLKVLALI
jgi:F0F1-type ATP synthase membrane subunit c/vacuolar-type H+-ATPase subunit K